MSTGVYVIVDLSTNPLRGGSTPQPPPNLPLALSTGLNHTTVLDDWLAVVEDGIRCIGPAGGAVTGHSSPMPSSVKPVVIANGLNYKHVERWCSSHGIDIHSIVNTGLTRHMEVDGEQRHLIADSRSDALAVAMKNCTLFWGAGDPVGNQREPQQQCSPHVLCFIQLDSATPPTVSEAEHLCAALKEASKAIETTTQLPQQPILSVTASDSSTHIIVAPFPENCHDHSHIVDRLVPYKGSSPTTREGTPCLPSGTIHCRRYARVGLLGNPSDIYGGKTVSFTVSNYYCDVFLRPNADPTDSSVMYIPNPLNDPMQFGSIGELSDVCRREGYCCGIQRLFYAACVTFHRWVEARKVPVAAGLWRGGHGRGYTVEVETNIPRQVGLAGSSCVLTAIVTAMLAHYRVPLISAEGNIMNASAYVLGQQHPGQASSDDDGGDLQPLHLHLIPQLILEIETVQLGVAAGPQDRVCQLVEGVVYMDFDKTIIDRQGFGDYRRLAADKAPQFYLAYAVDPRDSGKKHSTVFQRYLQGDEQVVKGIQRMAEIAASGCGAFESGDVAAMADLMDENFSIRRRLFGDAALGQKNLNMVAIAQRHGAAVKFPGSGGATLILCRDAAPAVVKALKRDLNSSGCVLVPLSIQTHRVLSS